MSLNKTASIFKKQIKETLKNKEVLIQFIMFPVLTIIMVNTISVQGMPNNFFVVLFATMYIGMAPLTSMAAIVAEEKEKNTLRILLMSNVKAGEYLLGIGTYIFLSCMCGSLVFAILGKYQGTEFAYFMLIMAIGIIASIMAGAVIGTFSKNQMTATSITVPFMMVVSFMPMLSMFNDTIKKIAQVLYSQQVNNLIQGIGVEKLTGNTAIILSCNILIMIILFVFAYKRSGLT